jgi:hypothetical protein
MGNKLVKAYCKMYDLDQIQKAKLIIKGQGNTIIISPFSFNSTHAKSYPYWQPLIQKLKSLNNLNLVQIGAPGEEKLPGIDKYCFGLSFKEIEKRISECLGWISVDNFLPHLINCMPSIIPGCVIWGVSDPDIFGYFYNKNILKNKSYLRNDQFGVWKNEIKDKPGTFKYIEQ